MSAADPLSRAIAAVRAQARVPVASETAARNTVILRGIRREKRARHTTVALIAAACVVLGAGWASATRGLSLPTIWPVVQSLLLIEDPPVAVPTLKAVPASPAAGLAMSVVVPPAASAQPLASSSAVSAVLELSPPPAADLPPARTGVSAPQPTRVLPASNSARPASEPDEVYQAAHRAQFVERDPARALAAWDRYLAIHPQGRFVPEALFNRAVDLIRLGRLAEARAALRPFADGSFGGYRKSEAERLLNGL